jgi:formimidoylglutamate deiminase
MSRPHTAQAATIATIATTDTAPAADRPRTLWAPSAWLDGRWQDRVLLEIDSAGRWSALSPDHPCPQGLAPLPGPVLPGLVDAHSHAFQRAFAGLSERREGAHDDFWSWRDRMYRVAGALTPDELHAIAVHLYRELLRGGYTQVCEFHYLQHRPDGRPYDDPLAFAHALARAAADTGIGLTLLPVLYERAGFGQPALRPDQARFRMDAAAVQAACHALAADGHATLNAGLAVHSLRAATPEGLRQLAAWVADGTDGAGAGLPLHIHVAEQTAEVDDCLAATGQRPLQWLAGQGLLNPRWHLVHATHVTPAEIAAVAAAGASAVICPGTEADLGDGLTDIAGWLDAGVGLSVGSDSQVTRDWREELRWMDWGQRLGRRQRNVAAAPQAHQGATAARLFESACAAGGRAAGQARWGLQRGARADLLVIDPQDPALAGVPASHRLDALVFSAPAGPWQGVMVAGRWVIPCPAADGRPHTGPGPDPAYTRVMARLWGMPDPPPGPARA